MGMGTKADARQPGTRDTRAALVEAAIKLADAGDGDGSARRLADEAGVSASSIYDHFSTKDAIFDAAVATRIDDDGEVLSTKLARIRSLADLVHTFVEHRAARVRRSPLWTTFAAERRLLRGRQIALRAAYERDDARVARHLHAVQGELAEDLAALDAARILSTGVDGALLVALEERPQYLDDPAFHREVAGMLSAALLRHEAKIEPTRARSNATSTRYRKPDAPKHRLRKAPRQARSRDLVDVIYRGAERVIEERGIDSVATPIVAERAGVSIGSLYQYFGDRNSIFAGLIERWIEHDIAFVLRTLEELGDASFADLLRLGLLRAYRLNVRFLPLYAGIFRLLPRVSRYAAAQEFLSRMTAEIAGEAAKRPGAESFDVELTTFTLGFVFVAWVRRFIVEQPELFASEAMAKMLDRMCRGALAERRVDVERARASHA